MYATGISGGPGAVWCSLVQSSGPGKVVFGTSGAFDGPGRFGTLGTSGVSNSTATPVFFPLSGVIKRKVLAERTRPFLLT